MGKKLVDALVYFDLKGIRRNLLRELEHNYRSRVCVPFDQPLDMLSSVPRGHPVQDFQGQDQVDAWTIFLKYGVRFFLDNCFWITPKVRIFREILEVYALVTGNSDFEWLGRLRELDKQPDWGLAVIAMRRAGDELEIKALTDSINGVLSQRILHPHREPASIKLATIHVLKLWHSRVDNELSKLKEKEQTTRAELKDLAARIKSMKQEKECE